MFDLYTMIMLIELLTEGTVLSVLGYYYGYWRPRQPYVLILRREQDVLAKAKQKLVKLKDEDVSFGNHSYHLNWRKCAYLSEHGKPVLVFLEGSTEPINYEDTKFNGEHDSGKFNLLAEKKVIKQLVEASKQTTPFATNLVLLILVGAVCFMIGVFVAPYITSH